MGPTALLPLRRKTCWGFFRPKNPTASAGCEPANLGTKGQQATSRPPKPVWRYVGRRVFHKKIISYSQKCTAVLMIVVALNSENNHSVLVSGRNCTDEDTTVGETDQVSVLSGAVNTSIPTSTTNYQTVEKKSPYVQCCIPSLCTRLVARPTATVVPTSAYLRHLPTSDPTNCRCVAFKMQRYGSCDGENH
jgi:hypothetical protein